MTNNITKPNHYIGLHGLEVEEVTQNFLPRYKDGYVSHRAGSAIEYLLRAPLKNGIEDIKKAKENLEQIIEYEESKPIEIEGVENDPLNEFLKALRDIGVINTDVNNKITTFYAGTNPND